MKLAASRIHYLRLLGVSLATVFLLVGIRLNTPEWLRGPAPYPDEWQYLYEPRPMGGTILMACAIGVLLVALLLLSEARYARRHPRRSGLALIACACVLGTLLQWELLQVGSEHPGGAAAELVNRTYHSGHTSYFLVAVKFVPEDSGELIRRHAEILPWLRFKANHASTHPPGPVLYYRGLIELFGAWPGLTRTCLGALDLCGIDWRGLPPPRVPPHLRTPAHVGAALFGAALLGVLAVLACLPALAVGRLLGAGWRACGRLAVLWAAVPAVSVWLPQFDQVLAFLIAATWALMAFACTRKRTLHAALLAVGAGVFGGLAVFISYGAAVFLALAGVSALVLAWRRPDPTRRSVIVGGVSAGVTMLLFFAPALAGAQPLLSLATGLTIHMEEFTRVRSHLTWIFFNPIDVLIYMGPPVMLVGLMRGVERARALAAPESRKRLELRDWMLIGALAGAFILNLAGVTRGETGRLWLPMMPVWFMVVMMQPPRVRGEPAEGEWSDWPRADLSVVSTVLMLATSLVLKLTWQF